LVDDDDGFATQLRGRLGGESIELDWASGYRDGIDGVCRGSHDACLVSMQLDEQSGVDLVRAVRRAGSTKPILMLTGRLDDEHDRAALRAGALDYLVKSEVDGPSLVRAVRRAIERARLEEQLAAGGRLQALGSVAARLAHEVNNPAQYVLVNLEMLSEHVERLEALLRSGAIGAEPLLGELAALRELVSESVDGMRRIAELMGDLSAQVELQEDTVGLVDLADVVDAACALLLRSGALAAAPRLSVAEVGSIHGYHTKLVQAVMNLLMHAAGVGEGSGGRDLAVTVRRRAGSALIVVSCAGEVDVAHLRRILDHRSAARLRPDEGDLRLSIAAAICEQHRGRIGVSEIDGGYSLEVELPIDTGLAPQTLRGRGERRARVLVADDEPYVCRSLARALRSHDVVMVTTTADLLEALAAASEFDAVVCDLMMAGSDDELAPATVQRLAPHLAERMVLVSGGAVTAQAAAFSRASPTTILHKPVSSEDLRAAVATSLRAR
jgi:DNA-binding response OmpR family regulator